MGEELQKCWQNRSETQSGSRFQTDFMPCVIATGGQVQILWADLACFKPIKTAAVQKQLSLKPVISNRPALDYIITLQLCAYFVAKITITLRFCRKNGKKYNCAHILL